MCRNALLSASPIRVHSTMMQLQTEMIQLRYMLTKEFLSSPANQAPLCHFRFDCKTSLYPRFTLSHRSKFILLKSTRCLMRTSSRHCWTSRLSNSQKQLCSAWLGRQDFLNQFAACKKRNSGVWHTAYWAGGLASQVKFHPGHSRATGQKLLIPHFNTWTKGF